MTRNNSLQIEERKRVYSIGERYKVVEALQRMGYEHEDRIPNEYGSFMMKGNVVADIQPSELHVFTNSKEGKSLAEILSQIDIE